MLRTDPLLSGLVDKEGRPRGVAQRDLRTQEWSYVVSPEVLAKIKAGEELEVNFIDVTPPSFIKPSAELEKLLEQPAVERAGDATTRVARGTPEASRH